MQVTLTHAEIQAAVVQALVSKGINVDGEIAIAFTRGRKNSGLSASVEVVDPSIKRLPGTLVESDDTSGVPQEPEAVAQLTPAQDGLVSDGTTPVEAPAVLEADASAAPAAPVTSSEAPESLFG